MSAFQDIAAKCDRAFPRHGRHARGVPTASDAGARVIHMEVGQPGAPAPAAVLEAARTALADGRFAIPRPSASASSAPASLATIRT